MSSIKVCKRINNSKRNFLVLNERQCKHVPASPSSALLMFSKLGISLKDKYKNERVLVVGFAETATAIGVAVARVLHCDFIQTTREICNGDKFNFIEEHSHATDQRLYCTDFSDYDRILFVEDEVTTGNTILNIINLLKKRCTDIKFGAASIVNGMSEKNLLHFKQNNINVDYSEHIDNSGYSDMIENLVEFQGHKVDYTKFSSFNLNYLSISDKDLVLPNTRFKTDIEEYEDSLHKLCGQLHTIIYPYISDFKCIRVLGTEEFMYPAIYFASLLESEFYVTCHSTTRSPIAVSKVENYPLKDSIKLPSVYDRNRETYLYNTCNCSDDAVIIITEESATNVEPLIKHFCDNNKNTKVILVKVGGK